MNEPGSLDPADRPLEGVSVLDFSQFLAGPSCTLRLADLGARVTKVERPQGGDACRQLYVADQACGPDSLLFHTINRDKGSIAADLKDPADLERVKALVRNADVMVHNFRPGVMERIGLGHEAVADLNPAIVYGVVSGYGTRGPWKDKPGQDLLVQARSGMAWLSGNAGDDPVPVGFAVSDISAGAHLVQGVLAALVRRGRTGRGALVEVSLLASALDVQFEQVTSFLNPVDGTPRQPERSAVNGANVNATAPYGIYRTSDGYLAIAMTPIATLAELLACPALLAWGDPALAFAQRDAIKRLLANHLISSTTDDWLARLEPAGVWCAELLDWPTLERSDALAALGALQSVPGADGSSLRTTVCPIRIDGDTLGSRRGAPALGCDPLPPLPEA